MRLRGLGVARSRGGRLQGCWVAGLLDCGSRGLSAQQPSNLATQTPRDLATARPRNQVTRRRSRSPRQDSYPAHPSTTSLPPAFRAVCRCRRSPLRRFAGSWPGRSHGRDRSRYIACRRSIALVPVPARDRLDQPFVCLSPVRAASRDASQARGAHCNARYR